MITPDQRAAIDLMRERLGWAPEHLDNWLQRSFKMKLAQLSRRHDASRVLIALEKVLKHAIDKAGREMVTPEYREGKEKVIPEHREGACHE